MSETTRAQIWFSDAVLDVFIRKGRTQKQTSNDSVSRYPADDRAFPTNKIASETGSVIWGVTVIMDLG